VSANVLTPGRVIVADGDDPAASVSAWDLELLAKSIVRRPLDLYDVSRAQLARRLGLESTAHVDACLSDHRDNAAPLWWFLHPGFPSQVRAHVFEDITRRTLREPLAAETPEHQLGVALGRVGHFVTIAGATMDEVRVSGLRVETAAQLLRVVDGARHALDGLSARLRQRVDTGGFPAARGGP